MGQALGEAWPDRIIAVRTPKTGVDVDSAPGGSGALLDHAHDGLGLLLLRVEHLVQDGSTQLHLGALRLQGTRHPGDRIAETSC